MDVGNLISGSSAFSKSSLNISKFLVHVLLKPGLENFEHYFASVSDEWNCIVLWTFFGIGMKNDLSQSCGHCWVFKFCWHIECSAFTASSHCFPLSLCYDHWGRLSYLSVLFFGNLCSNRYIFPFLLFFSQLFVRPPQTIILPFCTSSWGWSW